MPNVEGAWVIDEMVRALMDCAFIEFTTLDCNGKEYKYPVQGQSKACKRLVRKATAGLNTYEMRGLLLWKTGTTGEQQ